MRYEGSPVKAPPLSRRRMTPPALVQNSCTSFEREQESYEEEGRGMECERKNKYREDETVSGKEVSV